MTITPDRIDDLDFPTPEIEIEDRLPVPIIQTIESITGETREIVTSFQPLPRPTMAEYLEAMNEMETEYQSYLHERAAQSNPVHPFYDDMVAARQRILEQSPARRQAQRVIDEQRARFAEEERIRDRDWYCYCSPTRGHYLNRMRMAQSEDFADYQPVYAEAQPGPLVIEYRRWEPQPEPSKELVVFAQGRRAGKSPMQNH